MPSTPHYSSFAISKQLEGYEASEVKWEATQDNIRYTNPYVGTAMRSFQSSSYDSIIGPTWSDTEYVSLKKQIWLVKQSPRVGGSHKNRLEQLDYVEPGLGMK